MDNHEIGLIDLNSLLNDIYQKKDKNFSGIGLVVYSSLRNLAYESLGSSNAMDFESNVVTLNLADYLSKLASHKSNYHDGFHFLNQNLELTHISQYVCTPICELPDKELTEGARSRSALYLSNVKDIILVGIIRQGGQIIIFKNGYIVSDIQLTIEKGQLYENTGG